MRKRLPIIVFGVAICLIGVVFFNDFMSQPWGWLLSPEETCPTVIKSSRADEETRQRALWDVYLYSEKPRRYMWYPAGQKPFPNQQLVAKSIPFAEIQDRYLTKPKKPKK
jgi:hypothetical protein